MWTLLIGIVLFVFLLRFVTSRNSSGSRSHVPFMRTQSQTEKGGRKKVRALVTGGSGSLGKAIVRRLLEDGCYEVHSLDLKLPDEKDRNPHVSSYVQADVTNLDDLVTAFEGIDAVFHTAATLPRLGLTEEECYRVNVGGTINVVTACTRCHVSRLIYTSSGSAVMTEKGSFSNPTGPTPPNTRAPVNMYAGSKARAEEAVCASNGRDGLLTCALRPGMILGVDNVSTILCLTYRLFYYDDGHDCWQIAPIASLADAHLLAEKKLQLEGGDSVAAGNTYFICGVRVPMRDLYGKMEGPATTIWGQPPPFYLPKRLLMFLAHVNVALYSLTGVSVFGASGEGLVPANISMLADHNCDCTPACKELGWKMDFPPWEEMVRGVVKEYRQLLASK